MQQHCFSEDILDTTVHFQVLDLGRQLYVWAGTSDARMGPLCLASPPAAGAADRAPHVLLPITLPSLFAYACAAPPQKDAAVFALLQHLPV